ncbi:MAG: flagellar export chaperone FliS [Firmicutes bacterium]|nr:flagellar export chaperone FliS [Bacillota bacterium]
MGANPYMQYQKVQVETADQGRLLLMLYEGALRFLRRARKFLHDKNMEEAHNNLLRVEDIVFELMASLDLEKGGEVASALFGLYDYMYHLLLEANLKKDPQPLDQVEEMLEELGGTWKEALGEKKHPGTVHASKIPQEDQGKKNTLSANEGYGGYKEEGLKEKALLEVFDRLNLTR